MKVIMARNFPQNPWCGHAVNPSTRSAISRSSRRTTLWRSAPSGKMYVEGPLAHAEIGRQLVHADAREPVSEELRPGRFEDAAADLVAGGHPGLLCAPGADFGKETHNTKLVSQCILTRLHRACQEEVLFSGLRFAPTLL